MCLSILNGWNLTFWSETFFIEYKHFGTVMDTSSGKLKETIVDQVDGMETTLAHLFPEMTANIVTPVLTIVYLFVLDWRLALLSLVVFPVAFFFMMTVMGGYAKDYEGAVKATTEMSGTSYL